MSVELRDLADVDPAEVRRVVEAAFGEPRPAGWWEWKHRDGPWGPSFGMVAVEAGQVLSVRMLMPWSLDTPEGPVLGTRAVDAATVPEAQGRQLFSILNEALMAALPARGLRFIWSTSNQRSRNAYRRLGWRWLDPIAHHWSLLAPSAGRARLIDADPAEIVPAAPAAGVHTTWSEEAWRWRIDPRCGVTYDAARLGEAGVVYRMAPGGRRAIVLLATSGERSDVRRLVREVGRRSGARFAITVPGSGVEPGSRVGRDRGGSLIALWNGAADDAGIAGAWAPGFADLERVL